MVLNWQKTRFKIKQRLTKTRQWLQNAVRRRPRTFALLGALFLLWLFCLPRPLFDQPVSFVVEDHQGDLLGARIAADGQWRFPQGPAVPDKYARCVVLFEDRRFWWHPGVDPGSLTRAV
ncbi:MAG: transglycosylase domain-containing protein, partial [Saprospiraceae bacterium]|nr:transglycosylase domain-containing protein [Saprospiraceae bacterium]